MYALNAFYVYVFDCQLFICLVFCIDFSLTFF